MKRLIALALLPAGAMLAQHHSSAGELTLADYRKWVYLGSGVGMSYTGTSRENPHEEHAATDNTFVQFYPTLIETAKQHGTYKER